MPLTNNPFKYRQRALESRLLTLPVKIGDTAVLFSKQRFAQANWIGNGTEQWRKRKSFGKWGKTKRNKGRALLVDTGRLRRSIRIMSKIAYSITIGSDVNNLSPLQVLIKALEFYDIENKLVFNFLTK